MTTVCLLMEGDVHEGLEVISVHTNINNAKAAARGFAYNHLDGARYPLLDWIRYGNKWTVVSPNGVSFLEIRKMEVQA